MKRYCIILFCLVLCVSAHSQQTVLSGGNGFSSGNISATISLGEVFVNTRQHSSDLFLYTGVTDPVSDMITANGSIENEFIHLNYEPSSQCVYIKTNGDATGYNQCEVYSLHGNLVLKKRLGEVENSILLNGLIQGLYILKITVGKKSEVYKLIKNN